MTIIANFSQAWLLLGVGMITVFIILWLVVLIGNGLILFVNRFVPVSQSGILPAGAADGTDKGRIAAIVAAVQAVTGGRGRVTKIERKQ